MFDAHFVLVSHGTETDSIFNFGNRAALELFELGWEEFIRLPSRESADQDNKEDRSRLMARVHKEGYVPDCSGVRISSTGKRFLITGATVWNVIDDTINIMARRRCFPVGLIWNNYFMPGDKGA